MVFRQNANDVAARPVHRPYPTWSAIRDRARLHGGPKECVPDPTSQTGGASERFPNETNGVAAASGGWIGQRSNSSYRILQALKRH